MESPASPLASIDNNTRLLDIASRRIVQLSPGNSIGAAAALMAEKRISSIVVTDNQGRPVGIVTESNIVSAMQSGQTAQTPLRGVMSTPVVTVAVSTTCLEAYQTSVRDGARHIVIVDGDGLALGIVSETDFRRRMKLISLAGRRLITSIMSHTVCSLAPESSLHEALSLMQAHRDSCVVVVKDQYPIGIVTERDIVRIYVDNPEQTGTAVGGVMTSPVLTINRDETIPNAAERMLAAGIRHMVVVDHDGRLVGLLTEHELTNAMAVSMIEDKMLADGTFLHILVNAIPDLIWLKDVNGVYLACNPRFERLYGAAEKDIVGKTDFDFVDEQLADFFREHDLKAVAAGQPSSNEEWLTFAADGYQGCFETIKTPMHDNAGRLIGVLGIARDITERKQAEVLLLKQKQFSDDVINSLPGIFYMLDRQGGFVRVNPKFLEVTGYSNAEIHEISALKLFDGQDRRLVAEKISETFQTGNAHIEAEFITKSGRRIPYYFSGQLTYLDNQPYLVGMGIDISERKQAEKALLITAGVFSSSQEGIMITDAGNKIIDVNPAFSKITGYGYDEALGKDPKFMSSGRQPPAFYNEMWESLLKNKVWRGEIWNRRKNGEVYAEMLSIALICDTDGKILRHVAVFSDINHLKEYEAELSRAAHFDALTGIPNRVLLADRMRQAIARTAREGNIMAVCYLDLDGFKPINDGMGHEMGDNVLIEVAKRIEQTIRGGDTVARLGGDEFVVLLLGQETADECLGAAQRLLSAISKPITAGAQTVTVSASIGISLYPLDDEAPDTLLRHADQAMYVAKQKGKSCFHIFDPALDILARSQHEFLANIALGLEQGEFELYYQPKINLQTQELVGVEALIRWRHQQRGLLSPAEFLSAVENTELDVKIGEWVIAAALTQTERWRRDGLDIDVSINISGYHLESPGFSDHLQQLLDQYPPFRPGSLQIEILETTAISEIAIVKEIIESCRKMGVEFALDDFGTGYSSLSYLSRLPVNALKIDQSFIRDMLVDRGDNTIIQGIIALANAFELQTVAEGIETQAQSIALMAMGAEIGQGYCIARPMPANELLKWHARRMGGSDLTISAL